jgi:hypothetical protein
MAGKNGIDERNLAERAILTALVIENAHAVVVSFRKVDALAILAPEALHIRLQLHRRAARRTVH